MCLRDHRLRALSFLVSRLALKLQVHGGLMHPRGRGVMTNVNIIWRGP